MTCRARVLVILSSAALVGCDGIDLVGPEPAPPFLFLSVNVLDAEERLITVGAAFFPGVDANGIPGVLADSMLGVNDETVLPTAGPSGELLYQHSVQPSGIDSLMFVGPSLAGDQNWGDPGIVYLPWRAEPFRADLKVGDSIAVALPQLRVPPAATSTGAERWHLSAQRHRESRFLVSIEGSGRDSSRVAIPWEWIGSQLVPGDTVSVHLNRWLACNWTGAPFEVDVALLAQFRWQFVVTPRQPGSSAATSP